jgi:hypothetical protein
VQRVTPSGRGGAIWPPFSRKAAQLRRHDACTLFGSQCFGVKGRRPGSLKEVVA